MKIMFDRSWLELYSTLPNEGAPAFNTIIPIGTVIEGIDYTENSKQFPITLGQASTILQT